MTRIGAAVWDYATASPGLRYFGKQSMATAKLVVKTHRTVDGVAQARVVPIYARNKDIELVSRGVKRILR